MSEAGNASVTMAVDTKKYGIRIHKALFRQLGEPRYIQLLVNFLRPDGHSRKRSLRLGWMRSSRQYPCRDSFLSNRGHISRSGYPFQPITYLSRLSASCIVLQKYHYSSPSCHRQSTNTVFWPTRRVIDRSSTFLTESWRSHPAACPFR